MMQEALSHAVVTGAASGIGAAVVRRLLDDGYCVHAFDIDDGRLRALKEQMGSVHLMTVVGDVCSPASVAGLRQMLQDDKARLDVLVCCAGVLRVAPLAETSEQDWDSLFSVNVKGAFLVMQALTPLMIREAGLPRACVVVLTSAAAVRPKTGGGAYAATKAALTQIVKVWAVELAPHGVNVNAVAPGTVNTPMAAGLASAGGGFALSGKAPIGRMAEAVDIADAISLLYDRRAHFVTGAVLAVDGGLTAAFVPPSPPVPSIVSTRKS